MSEDLSKRLLQSRNTIDTFLDALWMERGLAENTLLAYRRDLERFARWLAARRSNLDQARRPDVLDYLADDQNAPARTVARRLSTLKRYFQYEVREARRRDDPSAGLGLHCAYRAVKEHGGRIHIRSKPNEGTTVRVVIPYRCGVGADYDR